MLKKFFRKSKKAIVSAIMLAMLASGILEPLGPIVASAETEDAKQTEASSLYGTRIWAFDGTEVNAEENIVGSYTGQNDVSGNDLQEATFELAGMAIDASASAKGYWYEDEAWTMGYVENKPYTDVEPSVSMTVDAPAGSRYTVSMKGFYWTTATVTVGEETQANLGQALKTVTFTGIVGEDGKIAIETSGNDGIFLQRVEVTCEAAADAETPEQGGTPGQGDVNAEELYGTRIWAFDGSAVDATANIVGSYAGENDAAGEAVYKFGGMTVDASASAKGYWYVDENHAEGGRMSYTKNKPYVDVEPSVTMTVDAPAGSMYTVSLNGYFWATATVTVGEQKQANLGKEYKTVTFTGIVGENGKITIETSGNDGIFLQSVEVKCESATRTWMFEGTPVNETENIVGSYTDTAERKDMIDFAGITIDATALVENGKTGVHYKADRGYATTAGSTDVEPGVVITIPAPTGMLYTLDVTGTYWKTAELTVGEDTQSNLGGSNRTEGRTVTFAGNVTDGAIVLKTSGNDGIFLQSITVTFEEGEYVEEVIPPDVVPTELYGTRIWMFEGTKVDVSKNIYGSYTDTTNRTDVIEFAGITIDATKLYSGKAPVHYQIGYGYATTPDTTDIEPGVEIIIPVPVGSDYELSMMGTFWAKAEVTVGDTTMSNLGEGGRMEGKVITFGGTAEEDEIVIKVSGGDGIFLQELSIFCEKHDAILDKYDSDKKIDVWDFGGVEESDTDKYNNNIKKSDLDSLSAELFLSGSTGRFKSSGELTFGDLVMKYAESDRLYYNNADDTAKGTNSDGFDSYKNEFADGYTSKGAYYAAGVGDDEGKSNRALVINNVLPGDMITAYAYVDDADMEVALLYLGSKGVQEDTVPAAMETYTKASYVAEYPGSYLLYMKGEEGQGRYLRVTRTPGVLVSGTIDTQGAQLGEYSVVLRDKDYLKSFEVFMNEDGSYKAYAPANATVSAVLRGPVGYDFTDATKAFKTGTKAMENVALVVEQKSLITLSGKINGFAEGYSADDLKLVLVSTDTALMKDDTLVTVNADKTFTVQIEQNVEYKLVMSGANDYVLAEEFVVSGATDIQKDIKVKERPHYAVTGEFLGLADGAKVESIKFTNLEDGYEYTGTLTDKGYTVSLRDGAYKITAPVDGYKVIAHVVVDGADVVEDILYTSTAVPAAMDLVKDIYVGYPAEKLPAGALSYDKMRDAVAACKAMKPSKEEDRITVHIYPGIYRQQLIIETPYLTFINDYPEVGDVLLTWYYGVGYKYYSSGENKYYDENAAFDKYLKHGVDKWGAATYLKSSATDFKAENIVFETSFNRYMTAEEIADGVEPALESGSAITVLREAGTDVTRNIWTERSTALAVEADRTEFKNCSVLGGQDTLFFGGNTRSYFKNCLISGHVDYIFGNCDAIFDDCELQWHGKSDTPAGGYITAMQNGAKVGTLFRDCIVTEHATLQFGAGNFGRPWREGAKVAFINTILDAKKDTDIINADGWSNMSSNKVENAEFKEFNTRLIDGTPANTSKRVTGVIDEAEAKKIWETDYFYGWKPTYYVEKPFSTDMPAIPETPEMPATPEEPEKNSGDVIPSESVVGEGAPKTTIKSKSADLETAIGFTSNEKAAIKAGTDASVWLKVNKVTPAENIKKLVADTVYGKKVGMYLDLELFKKVGDMDAKAVTETEEAISITINVPDELLNKDSSKVRNYAIVRVHNEVAKEIDVTFDAESKAVTFKTDKFSTYALAYTDTDPNAKLPAFPGVEGGGKYITGGRGKEVITVTNVNDSGEGSLRWALEQAAAKGGATIVFNVAGNIELKSSLRFDGVKNVTIAGQTAPGDGITISGYDTNISGTENVIIRYLRFRPGAINVHSGGDSMDAMWGRDNDGFIIDHCSFSWNTDECLSLYRGENGTVQWCMVYESLALSGHGKGRHGYGGITGGDKVTWHHNLYANHTSRNPRIGGGYAGAADNDHIAVLQFSNNMIYNWGFNTCYGGGSTYTNFINNYSLAGPGTRDSVKNWVINPGEKAKDGYYINNNIIADYTGALKVTGNLATPDAINANGRFSGSTADDENKTELRTTPFVSTESSGVNNGVVNEGFDEYNEGVLPVVNSTYKQVLDQAGATYPRRDAQDARLVSEVRNGEGSYINTEHEVGGYLSEPNVITASRAADFDTDGDGMPDAWETENGLNPKNANDGKGTSDLSVKFMGVAGYTNLEVYLSSLVDIDHVAENARAEIVTPEKNAAYNVGETVEISVEAKSDFGHDIKKVEIYYGTISASQKAGDATKDGENWKYELKGLKDGSYFITARVTDSEGNVTQTSMHEIHVNADAAGLKAEGWSSTDIGAVNVAGTGSLVDGVLTVKGNGKLGTQEGSVSGEAKNAKTDSLHYVYKEFTGDVEITAKLESITSVDNHAFAGIMIREDLEKDAAAVALGVSWTKTSDDIRRPWGMWLAAREEKGASMPNLSDALDGDAAGAAKSGIVLRPNIKFKDGATDLGYWMRLVRKGDTFSAYASADGEKWELIGSKTVDMNDKVYIGFGADSNQAANELYRLNTARFTNVSVVEDVYAVNFELENINVDTPVATVAKGQELVLAFSVENGYNLPKTLKVSMGGAEFADAVITMVDPADPMEGTLTITNVTGDVIVKGAAEKAVAGREQTTVTESHSHEDLLTITTDENGAMIMTQTAESGQLNEKPKLTDESARHKNASYVLFPATADAVTMEMDVTITGRTNDDSSKMGLFVGAFDMERGYFATLGFRHASGKDGDSGQGLTAVWNKAGKPNYDSGNGGSKSNNGGQTKPSYALNETYHVKFEKLSNGFKVSYTGKYKDGTDMDLYKVFGYATDSLFLETDEVQYGLALLGVTAKIENLTLTDSKGRNMYVQNDKISHLQSFEALNFATSADGWKKEDLVRDLPATIKVIYESDTFVEKAVTWDTSAIADVYMGDTDIVLTGEVEGVSDLKASIKLVIGADDQPAVDTTALEASIAKAEALNKADYTAKSWAGVETALAAAKAELNNTAATVDSVAAAVTALDDAVKALVKAEDEDDEEDEDEEDEDDKEKEDGKSILDAITSPKTFFSEGSFIHSILWPDTDSEQETAVEQADSDAAEEAPAENADAAAGALVQSGENNGLGSMFAIIIVAAVAVIAASGVILFRKKDEEL